MVGLKDFEMPKSCFLCGLKFQGVCPRLIKNVQGLRTERLLDCPLVEAIPKDQYEARLKADLKAILVELKLEIEEIPYYHGTYVDYIDREKVIHKIQQKGNALKENTDGNI